MASLLFLQKGVQQTVKVYFGASLTNHCCLEQQHLCFSFQKRTQKMVKTYFGASLAVF